MRSTASVTCVGVTPIHGRPVFMWMAATLRFRGPVGARTKPVSVTVVGRKLAIIFPESVRLLGWPFALRAKRRPLASRPLRRPAPDIAGQVFGEPWQLGAQTIAQWQRLGQ